LFDTFGRHGTAGFFMDVLPHPQVSQFPHVNSTPSPSARCSMVMMYLLCSRCYGSTMQHQGAAWQRQAPPRLKSRVTAVLYDSMTDAVPRARQLP
jgi:hypothetical protein